MKKILLGTLGAAVLALTTTVVTLHLGLISFAADEPHSALVRSLIEFARERSIAKAAASISAPGDLGSPEQIRRGAGNYEAMCAGCHLSPGIEDTEIRKGLYPQPPDLSLKSEEQASETADARRFQIIKHGIKGSGMPAWAMGGMDDRTVWDLVALLRVLPVTSPADYRALVKASDGHSHAGMEHGEREHNVHKNVKPHNHAGHNHHPH